jgi:hypothetical protein
MKVLNENSKSQFSRSVSPAMIRRKTANEKKVAELIDLAEEKQFDLVKVKVKEKIKEYSPILNWFNFELEYSQTSLIRTIFFEKFCSDNRNSGLLKVLNIRLGLELFLPMSGLSRIPG